VITELKQLQENNQTRLISLTGTGGVGKTRLALQLAKEFQSASVFKDGIWLVELDLLPELVASVLGLREESAFSVKTLLINYLHNRNLLLILDNCEHLIAACTEFVQVLLQTCDELLIVITSRESLNIPGEFVFQVPHCNCLFTVVFMT
jgi:non-specific serine/threonine protein kinase